MSSRRKAKGRRARLDRATRAYRARLDREAAAQDAMQEAVARATARKAAESEQFRREFAEFRRRLCEAFLRRRCPWWRRLLRRLTGGLLG